MILADVSNSSETKAMVTETIARYGRMDCAFNNAVFPWERPYSSADHSEEDWDRVIGINLTGVWLSMKAEIPQMLPQGGGSIVNTASIMGLISTPGVG